MAKKNPILFNSSKPHVLVLLSLVLLLRSRIITGPRDLLHKLSKVGFRKDLSPSELAQALQKLYVEGPDGTKQVLVPFRDTSQRFPYFHVPIHPISDALFSSHKPHFPPFPLSAQNKPNVDRAFVRQLLAILRITFPSYRSSEVGIVLVHSTFLVLRTVLSVGVAKLDGKIVKSLVSADGRGFLRGLGLWFLLAIPSTYTNSMIRHLQSRLSLRLRTRLTRYTHDLYLSSDPHLRYYRISGQGGIDGVDQYITADIASWADSLSGLYGNVLKPFLDLTLFTSQLSRTLGVRGTAALFLTYYATARILRAVTPAFGRLAAIEARLEGEYRAGVGRVGREAEEVAFYDGGQREREILWRAYLRLIKHVNSIFKIRIAYEWTEDYVIKYLWSAAGYCLISIPVLFTRRRVLGVQAGPQVALAKANDAVADRTENYISSRRLLLSLADAGGRLMYAYKDILELAGLTTRLYALLSSLHNLPPLPTASPADSGNPRITLDNVDVSIPTSGTHEEPLVKALSLSLCEGEHLMITGSNGVGKTAVARVLAGIWAPGNERESKVHRPGRGEVFVVPQRAYMVTGSLLDQIIYPHTYTQFEQSGRAKEELMEILEAVHLAYLPTREGGWETRKEWRDVLSGGEKQRMAMARVFYHKPKFAILDECTSAVSSDVEGQMYEHAKSLGITLITISLRPSLAKYHTQLLTLSGDGTGSWTLARIGTAEARMGIDREIGMLQSKLKEVERWERQVKELEILLGPQSAAGGITSNN
ncbi:ABC transporter transmembrane region 2-domain-containing protein [Multifurca ochricompacta]|uniref:ABC transporter transmembrane region 2-domain-containing protein n=1 Tax=Multifurca ochricompacta TaxID=376703 RepID=A0AAD4M7L3_9AGAM|nr:ABC transporter transmembrane region 2-domain-containing protein [Multifurca ochricompacta]